MSCLGCRKRNGYVWVVGGFSLGPFLGPGAMVVMGKEKYTAEGRMGDWKATNVDWEFIDNFLLALY